MNKTNMLNSQTIQELKNSTIVSSQNIQKLKNSIIELKGFTQINTQAIAKMEGKIGQIANHLGEREREKFLNQLMSNSKGKFVVRSSSAPTHGQEHVQAIVTLWGQGNK